MPIDEREYYPPATPKDQLRERQLKERGVSGDSDIEKTQGKYRDLRNSQLLDSYTQGIDKLVNIGEKLGVFSPYSDIKHSLHNSLLDASNEGPEVLDSVYNKLRYLLHKEISSRENNPDFGGGFSTGGEGM